MQTPTSLALTGQQLQNKSEDKTISGIKLAAMLRGSRPGVQSASLYDNFCKTGNVIIWVQDGNCKK